jgi:uncharacterized protein (DUF302 family)
MTSASAPFFVVKTTKSFEKTLQDLHTAVANNNFTVIHVHDLQKTFAKNNLQSAPYVIVELCNAQMAFQAISLDPRMGNMMPKKIIVFVDQDGTTNLMLMRPNPAMFDTIFPGLPIAEMSEQVMKTMEKIIEETK